MSRDVISCCLSECALYSDRIPNVAPESYLLISHGAVLKLQSTQSRCGFQALTHAEKLQLIHACRPSLFCCTILVFSCPKSVTIALSYFFSPAVLMFSCLLYTVYYLKLSPGHKVLHPAKDLYSRSLGVGQPGTEGGTCLKNWSGISLHRNTFDLKLFKWIKGTKTH